MKSVKLRDKLLKIPIIQGGMGVGISLANLAGNVMRQTAMGVLSFAHPGYRQENFLKDSLQQNILAMQEEVDKARKIAQGEGLLGVNIMVASSDYASYVKACCQMDVDVIISGAGLPLNLPELVMDSDVMIAPIVSSAKALSLILRRWQSRYQRLPDFVVIEGPLAGGHLGFKKEEVLAQTYQSLEEILAECLAIVAQYPEKIPLFVAGGIYTGADIAHFIRLGASGVQMGTRFIATHECDAHPNFKNKFIQSSQEDIQIVNSPTGFPGRAFSNKFTQMLAEKGKIPIRFCVNCLVPCNPADTVYCITDALIRAAKGDVKTGLVFTGSNGYRINKIVSVKELIDELMAEMKECL